MILVIFFNLKLSINIESPTHIKIKFLYHLNKQAVTALCHLHPDYSTAYPQWVR